MPYNKSSIDRFSYTVMLYDFYGPLLTKKQSEIIELYYMNDLSLSEIGAELGITRQAASILISRTEKILLGYENRLGLVEKHVASLEKVGQVVSELAEICASGRIDAEIKERIEKTIRIAGEL